MKIITKYKAIDGVEFDDQAECVNYEILIRDVDNVMSLLNPIPDDTDFYSGKGYVQQDEKIFKRVKDNLLLLIYKKIKHDWIVKSLNGYDIHHSYISRLLSDYGINPFINAWCRISCTDSQHREWGQPYYASNPERGENIKLN